MKRKSSIMTLLMLLSFFPWKVMAERTADYWVVANPSVAMQSLTKDELKQILLTNQTSWGDGKKVFIVTLTAGTDEADKIAMEFMGYSSIQAKKHWLTKVFGGVIQSVPKAVDSIDEEIEAVEKTPGSFAVVPAGTKTGKAKVIRIKP